MIQNSKLHNYKNIAISIPNNYVENKMKLKNYFIQ